LALVENLLDFFLAQCFAFTLLCAGVSSADEANKSHRLIPIATAASFWLFLFEQQSFGTRFFLATTFSSQNISTIKPAEGELHSARTALQIVNPDGL
jgi:hypothetical protein